MEAQLIRPVATARPTVAWQLWLAGSLGAIAALHPWLLVLRADSAAPAAGILGWLTPIALLGPIAILVAVARQQHGRRRWAWRLQALSILLGGVMAECIQRSGTGAADGTITPLVELLFLVSYVPALVGGALYLDRRPSWAGGAARVVLDSVAVGATALALMQTLLPHLLTRWQGNAAVQTWLHVLAFDVALLFVVGVLALRYGRSSGPLLILASLCILCLLLGDGVSLAVAALPEGARWYGAADGLYLLQYACLALGAYRSVSHPPQLPVTPAQAMPLAEWLVWTIVPRLLPLVVLATLIGHGTAPTDTIWLLLLLSVARELLATADHRRALHDLYRAQATAHDAEALARQAEQQTQDFLARMIHDLGSPLHGLQTGLRHLQGDQEIHHLTQLQVQHLHHLVEQLRAYQRARHLHTTQPVPATLDPAPICAAAITALQERAADQAVALQFDPAAPIPVVRADAAAIRRILDNLLTNALAATPSGGSITVQLTQPDQTVLRLAVTDTGCGIPADQHARIFAPLVRLAGHGTGLGLAIVHELAQAMGSAIQVWSAVGTGSTFWLDLPVACMEPPRGGAHVAHLRQAPLAPASGPERDSTTRPIDSYKEY